MNTQIEDTTKTMMKTIVGTAVRIEQLETKLTFWKCYAIGMTIICVVLAVIAR